jgi:asparagine synthase (glutamine-hydrolysing)
MQMGDKLMKLSTVLQVRSAEELYTHLMSQWRWPSRVVVGASDAVPPFVTGGIDISSIDEFVDWMMAADAGLYLPDDILVKVDRAAMAVSLETRVPFLDHRVVEFAWRLPQDQKIRGADTKWALRQLLYRHVPKTLIERPKMGFGAPIDQWLRGPLRDWAEALLDESRLKREGFFHPGPVRRYWEDHLIGRHNWQYPLWNVLMFQSWHEHWAAEDSAAPQSKAA